jgi:Zn-finger nucleic acid-binding protein
VDIIGKFFTLVGKIYTFPLHWGDNATYTGSPHWLPTVFFGAIIYGVTAVVLIALLVWAYRRIMWYRNRRPCQHHECGHQWTTHISDGSDPGCVAGQPCCWDCQYRHEDEAIERRAKAEPRRKCFHGHGEMEKVIVEDMIIDRCGSCGSAWLDGDELERIEQRVHDEGYDEGRYDRESASSSAAIAGGVAAGIAISN